MFFKKEYIISPIVEHKLKFKMTLLKTRPIKHMTDDEFAEFFQGQTINEEHTEETRNHLAFLHTLFGANAIDDYEVRNLVQVLLYGLESSSRSITKTLTVFKNFDETVLELKRAAEPWHSVLTAQGYKKVLLWHEQKIPFVPKSITSTAQRLLEATEFFNDKG